MKDELNAAIADYEKAASRYAECVKAEMHVEDFKPVEKHEAIQRLRALAESRSEKTSYSGMEKIVESEPAYAAFLQRRRDLVANKLLAYGEREAARFRAELALALLRTDTAEVVS